MGILHQQRHLLGFPFGFCPLSPGRIPDKQLQGAQPSQGRQFPKEFRLQARAPLVGSSFSSLQSYPSCPSPTDKTPSCFSDPTGNSKAPFTHLLPTFLPASPRQRVPFPVWIKRESVCQSHQVDAGTGCPSQDFSLKQRHLSIYFFIYEVSQTLSQRMENLAWDWTLQSEVGRILFLLKSKTQPWGFW